jgi:hypothetical protein
MNKLFFITVSMLLLASAVADCQWYQRRYGVSDINQLTQQQMTESFLRARGGTRAGALISGASAIGIVAGIIMFKHESPYPGDIGTNVIGILVLGGTIPMEITGLTIWGISGTRLQSIKAVMNNAKVSLGVMNLSPHNSSGVSNCNSIPCISIKYNF